MEEINFTPVGSLLVQESKLQTERNVHLNREIGIGITIKYAMYYKPVKYSKQPPSFFHNKLI